MSARHQPRCTHRDCRLIRARHDEQGRCPRGTGMWKPMGHGEQRPWAPRVPLSMSIHEATAVHEVLRCMQRGGDPRLIAKMHARALGNVLGIVERGRKRAATRNKSAAAPDVSLASTPPVAAETRVAVADPERAAQS